jgi:hypothetical protein
MEFIKQIPNRMPYVEALDLVIDPSQFTSDKEEANVILDITNKANLDTIVF